MSVLYSIPNKKSSGRSCWWGAIYLETFQAIAVCSLQNSDDKILMLKIPRTGIWRYQIGTDLKASPSTRQLSQCWKVLCMPMEEKSNCQFHPALNPASNNSNQLGKACPLVQQWHQHIRIANPLVKFFEIILFLHIFLILSSFTSQPFYQRSVFSQKYIF